MGMTFLDLENYPRRDHFAYFSNMAYPYVGLTAEMDVTGLKDAAKKAGGTFFLACLYAAAQAANGVPELRQRIINGKIAQFDHCDTSHTVLLRDGTYCYCQMDCRMPLSDFFQEAAARQANAGQGIDLEADETELFFVSCIPWVRYTALVQPTPSPADSNPRITFGKYVEENGKTIMPLTLLAHHGLVDGIHLGQFFHKFQEEVHKITAF